MTNALPKSDVYHIAGAGEDDIGEGMKPSAIAVNLTGSFSLANSFYPT